MKNDNTESVKPCRWYHFAPCRAGFTRNPPHRFTTKAACLRACRAWCSLKGCPARVMVTNAGGKPLVIAECSPAGRLLVLPVRRA